MGIKGLNSWICSTFPGVMQPAPKDGKGGGNGGPTSYDHVLFDANGIVHQACRKRPSEREVIRTIVFELDSLLRAYPPRVSVLIALDGPGPTAKLLEQRKRRIDRVLKAARDAEAAIPGSAEALRREELARLEGRPPPSQKKAQRKGFDSLQVTPGTAFMLRLRHALEWYAASRLAGEMGVLRSNGNLTPPIIFVSASDVAGEGELKLLQHLHAAQHWAAEADHFRIANGLPAHHPGACPPSFLLVGPDADLLLLGLAAGVRQCDVLTTDADGNRRLFKVAPLCDALQRQLSPARPPTADTRPANGGRGAGRGGSAPAPPHGAPSVSTSGHSSVSSSAPPSVSAPGAPDGPVCFGNLHQLDFLVLAFLQGNDYLPKLRGAQLPRMWARLARLLRSADFAGQHLLRPTAEGVEVNVHLLVELAGGTCETIASPEEEWEGEEEEQAEWEEGEEELAWGSHGAGGEASTAGFPGASAAARPSPCSSARKRPREALPRYDVDGYLHCLAWCAAMYLTGTCPDFSVAYTARAAPTAAQLARWLVVREETVTGRACMPVYRLPAASRMGVPMTPDVFSLCLLPAVAAAYLPRPLHALMEAGAPLWDIFHANQVRPVDLVSRVTEAVAAISRARYTPEERAMVETGGVSVWGIIPRGGGGYGGYGGAPMHPFLAGRRLEPLRCLPPSPIGTHGKGLGKGQGKGGGSGVGVLHFSPGAHGAPLGRWSWPDETGGHAAAGGATPRALPAHAVPAVSRPAAATPAPPLSGAAAVSGYSPQGPNLLGVLLPNLASCSAVPGAKLRSPPLPDAAAYGAAHVPAQPPRPLQPQPPWQMGGARPDLVRPPPPLHPVAFSCVPPPGLPAGHPAPPPPGSLPPPSAFMVGRGRGGSGAGGSTRA